MKVYHLVGQATQMLPVAARCSQMLPDGATWSQMVILAAPPKPSVKATQNNPFQSFCSVGRSRAHFDDFGSPSQTIG